MEPKDLLLPLFGALWALCTIVFNGTKELNAIRDRIMFDDAEGFRTTLPHRKLLARNDWLPLQILLNFASLIFGALAAFSPLLLKDSSRPGFSWLLAGFVGICAIAMSIALITTGVAEWRLMRACLKQQESESANDSKKSQSNVA